MPDLPVVLTFAPEAVSLQSLASPFPYETRELDCRHYLSDENLDAILFRERPDVIVSLGPKQAYPRLQSAPYAVRQSWLHFESSVPSDDERESIGALVWGLYLQRALAARGGSVYGGTPLVSVFTPTFRSGERIHRAYSSLQRQTYPNWEWTLVDDSDDGGSTLDLLAKMAEADTRLSVHPCLRRSGRIGEVKRRACALSNGEILVELDHDDELTPDALSDIVQAFQGNPQVGFVYSDVVEMMEVTGECLRYPEGWAFGYGSYRKEMYQDRELWVANAPPINGRTIRHIVGAPNHVRAWRTKLYWDVGGHNPRLHVADDYELIVRTFLRTEMLRIPKLLYIQYHSGTNTQDKRRAEIQRLVREIASYYEPQIQVRLAEIGQPA
jgi:glycosyltransferase involved in cell wall biosynthesis